MANPSPDPAAPGAEARGLLRAQPLGGAATPKAAETIARRVVQTILSRGLGAGDMLPREADMLDDYGVSRETLREALRLLEVQGLITLRRGPGGGPVVGSALSVNLGRVSTLYYQMAGATYTELFEAWVLGEGALAERAARNPDARRRARAMAPYIKGDHPGDHATVAGFMASHTAFHDVVGQLGSNRVLDLSLASFGKVVSYQAGVVDDPRILRARIDDDHIRIARAISAGHNRAARTLMQEHIGHMLEYFRDHFDGRLDEPVEWL